MLKILQVFFLFTSPFNIFLSCTMRNIILNVKYQYYLSKKKCQVQCKTSLLCHVCCLLFFFSLFGLRKSMKSLLQYNSERHCARNHTMHVDLCASNGAGHSSVCSCVRIIAPLDLEKVPESQFTQPSKFSCLLLQPGTIWSSCTNGSSNSHNIETEVCSLQEKAMLVHFTLQLVLNKMLSCLMENNSRFKVED